MTGSKRHVAEYAITDIDSAIKILKVLGRHDAKKNVYFVSDEALLALLTKDARAIVEDRYRSTGYDGWIWIYLNGKPYTFAVIGTNAPHLE